MTQLPQETGIHKQKLESTGQLYSIGIPEGYQEAESVPLILVLHWGGPVMDYTGEVVLLGLAVPGLYELGGIMLAPDRNTEDWANPQAEADLIELLDFIQEHYRIDKKRIVIVGYSLGGIGTWYMTARHPDRFSVAISLSAMPPKEARSMPWETPMYVIHSIRDELFSIRELSAVIDPMVEQGAPIEFFPIDKARHYNTENFIEPLRTAVPWVQKMWREQAHGLR
jgi:predicted peptidase